MSSVGRNRVPEIIALYWVIKIAATTLGETGADMFSMTYNFGYGRTIVVFLSLFAVLLAAKLMVKGYHPILYWAVFTASAIAGTGISDFIDRSLGWGYPLGSAVLVGLLLAVLGLWYAAERSIQVERIGTASAELYYWMAFLIANTLGTAAGDYLSDSLGLGFAQSAALITGVLVALCLAHYFTRLPGLLLFWLAFVLTRPFGATFGDLLTKPVSHGGLNLGTVGASAFFAVVLVLAVARETRLERGRR
ncbi:MAG TPA: hypothetical protein VNZ54_07705 [bacterium]|jgi:uncharacterized membrane-anchored protein|nr:hypothetical protein [bacterium]